MKCQGVAQGSGQDDPAALVYEARDGNRRLESIPLRHSSLCVNSLLR
jgi:hypothetical protein